MSLPLFSINESNINWAQVVVGGKLGGIVLKYDISIVWCATFGRTISPTVEVLLTSTNPI